MLAIALAGALAVVAGAKRGGPTTARVTAVVNGETLQVRLATGKSQRLRILGVAAPLKGSCYSDDAAVATRTLALNQTVKLSSTGAAAYVTLPGGSDLGRQLIADGHAEIDAWGSPFSRLTTYVPLQQAAETANKGLWGACAADLSVELTAVPSAVVVGDLIKYTATIKNAGPLAALDVDLDVRAPQGSPFDTAAADSGHSGCTPHGWYATCTFDSIPADGTVSAVFTGEAKKEGVASAAALVRISGCIRATCSSRPLHDSNVQND